MSYLQDSKNYLNNVMDQFGCYIEDSLPNHEGKLDNILNNNKTYNCYKCGIFPRKPIPIMVKKLFRKPKKLHICRICLGHKLGLQIVD